jgi:hypothetical protein
MNIEFLGPAVPAENGGISFRALVGDVTITCKFSMEILQDVNPDLTLASSDKQFEASKSALLAVAEKKIRAGLISNNVVQIFTGDL